MVVEFSLSLTGYSVAEATGPPRGGARRRAAGAAMSCRLFLLFSLPTSNRDKASLLLREFSMYSS